MEFLCSDGGWLRGLDYIDGEITNKNGFDGDKFGDFDLIVEVGKLGYASWS